MDQVQGPNLECIDARGLNLHSLTAPGVYIGVGVGFQTTFGVEEGACLD